MVGSTSKDIEVDFNQFWVQIKASTTAGLKELRNELIVLPPVLKVDSEATVETGIASTSLAMAAKTGYLEAF
ncbi:unnamed protein product, partial [Prunus brigantina]